MSDWWILFWSYFAAMGVIHLILYGVLLPLVLLGMPIESLKAWRWVLLVPAIIAARAAFVQTGRVLRRRRVVRAAPGEQPEGGRE